MDQDVGITGGKIHLSPGWCGNLLKFVRDEVVLTENGMDYGELNVEMESHVKIPLCTDPCLQLWKHRKPLGSPISLSRRDSPYWGCTSKPTQLCSGALPVHLKLTWQEVTPRCSWNSVFSLTQLMPWVPCSIWETHNVFLHGFLSH